MSSASENIESVVDAMSRLMRLMHMHKHRLPLFGDNALGRAQIEILVMLAHCSASPTMRELAVHLRVTGGAMTQIVAPLLKKGLVEKVADGTDKRVTRIVLTTDAKERIAAAKKAYVAAVTPAFAALSASDIAHLAQILQKLSTTSCTAIH